MRLGVDVDVRPPVDHRVSSGGTTDAPSSVASSSSTSTKSSTLSLPPPQLASPTPSTTVTPATTIDRLALREIPTVSSLRSSRS